MTRSRGKSVGKNPRWISWIGENSHAWQEGDDMSAFTQLFVGVVRRVGKRIKAIKDWRHFHPTDRNIARGIQDKKIGWFKSCENVNRINAALKIAQTLDSLTIDTNEINQDPLIVAAAKDCYIDLRKGKAIPVDKSLYITKKLGVVYDVEAKCPLWKAFLNQILVSKCNEDNELRYDPEYELFMQKHMGYALTGITNERTFINLHGDGTNGKSIFWQTIKAVMGDYCVKVDKSIIEKSGGSGDASKASPWIAHLVGVRLALLDEPSTGMRIDEGAFKTLVSSDTLHFRRLHCSPEEADPTAKFILAGNHEPNIENPDKAIANRWLRCAFLNEFDGDKEDVHLLEKLTTEKEKSGILNWMLEGWDLAQKDRKEHGRIKKPKCIIEWGKKYIAQEDLLGHFIKDCCVLGVDEKCSQRMLNVAHQQWNKLNGYRGITPITLGKRLRERKGIEEAKTGIEIWEGIGIKPEVFEVEWNDSHEGDDRYYPVFKDRLLHDKKIGNAHFYWWCKQLIRNGDLDDHQKGAEIGSKEHADYISLEVRLERGRF